MERRHTRRLVRYWVFLVLAYLFGLGVFIYYNALHTLLSSISASAGLVGPRYLMSAVGLTYLTGFVLAVVFLAFDVRARDVRENIVEVLDSRPLTNLELVGGRFLALFLSAWIPLIVLAVLVQGLGWLLPLLGSPFGATVEPLSLLSFVFMMAVPGFAFAIALVMAVTLLVRHRLLAALISIAVLAGLYAALYMIPGTYAPMIDYFGYSQLEFPSDLVTSWLLPGGWLQRFGFLVLALGLVGLAAAIHPRLDGGQGGRPAAVSAAAVLAGVVLVALVSQMRFGEAARLEQWRIAHEARTGEPVADIVGIDGGIRIDPGRRLDADLQVELEAPSGQRLDRVLLTLNPGLEIDEVLSADGQPLNAEHTNGLLDIDLGTGLAPGERTTLTLRYGGRPDTNFAYLDSVINLATMNLNEAQVGLLGYEPAIFDSRYVVLTSGIRWLPAAGADVGRDDPRNRDTDYFDVALDVEVPTGWLAAGPGRRQTLGSDGGRAQYRFAPGTSVPEVALVAGELESFATEIEGVTFEVLVHPDHDGNFEVLADSREEVERWVADRLEAAADVGLAYPFDAFTIVEVPNTLRAYKGGWRLDTALAPPAMMMLRETSFPTARFDFDAVAVFGTRDFDQEGGAARINRDRLVGFFSNDFSGGNLFIGASRSFFTHRTSAYGPEAIAINYALEELATLLIAERRGYFSAHLFTNINQSVTAFVAGLQGQQDFISVSDSLITSRTSQNEVWDAVLETAIADVDPWAEPQRTIDILTLKGGGMAQAIYDSLGADGVGRLLAAVAERHAGETFTLEDIVAAGRSVNEDLGVLFEDWIGSTGLPGFVARGAEVYRLPDSDRGDARYQLLVRIANNEPTVGIARVAWTELRWAGAAGPGPVPGAAGQPAATAERALSDPIRIPGRSAVEFGVVLSDPPTAAFVHPYLSLNRGNFLAATLNRSQVPSRDAEPLDGVRTVAFDTGRDERIVADDLDEGFAIIDDATGDMRLVGRGNPVAGTDQGLPIAIGNVAPAEWSRRTEPSAWGRYRHTMALIRGGGGGVRRAVMPATLPAAGTWELEIHLPPLQGFRPEDRGTWTLEVVSDDGRESLSYAASAGNIGWNLVGELRLPAGEVRVEISDETDGRVVVADAIAWSRVGAQSQLNASGSQ